MSYGMHVSRGWGVDPFAPECGCPVAPCGLVEPRSECPQHGGAKSLRQAHPIADCPAAAGSPETGSEPDA